MYFVGWEWVENYVLDAYYTSYNYILYILANYLKFLIDSNIIIWLF